MASSFVFGSDSAIVWSFGSSFMMGGSIGAAAGTFCVCVLKSAFVVAVVVFDPFAWSVVGVAMAAGAAADEGDATRPTGTAR